MPAFTSQAIWLSSNEMSICCPSPVASRWRNAARMPTAAYMPVMTSAMPTPTFIGVPSVSPVRLMMPPMPWIRKS
ncbi:Uncharacterised protein [Achromobacter xylosoxidans]|nr:Uncharacterised protein [Achromobacter xylosoxidans]